LTCAVVNRHTNRILGLSNRVGELEKDIAGASDLLREALNEACSLQTETSRMRKTIEELQREVNSAKRGRDGTVDSVDQGIDETVDEKWCAREGRMRLKVSVGWSLWKR
jgi:regulator of replication initiation timing